MRGPDDAVVWLHGDHLGSTSLATSATGEALSRQLYYPFGEQRWASAGLPTDFQFTGQRIQSTIALYDYHARFYDPYLNRFISADTIVPEPGNPQALNRYSYVNNNPARYTDPTGHCIFGGWDTVACIGLGVGLLLGLRGDTPREDLEGSDFQNAIAMALILAPMAYFAAGAIAATPTGVAVADTIGGTVAAADRVCAGHSCSTVAKEVVSRFSSSMTEALGRFAGEAEAVQAERGMKSFGETWSAWAELASESESVAHNLYVYQVGDKVMGAMKIAEGTNALEITHLEGLGGGAGTALVRTAVQESIARGFGGQIVLHAATQAVPFYKNLGFVLVNSATDEYFLSAEAAQALLQAP